MKYAMIILLMVLSFAVAACMQEPPTEINQIEFDQYDRYSRYITTGTAYYCTTSAQFNSVAHSHTAGDIIYLTDDTVLYIATETVIDPVKFYCDVICIDDGRAEVQIWNGSSKQFFDAVYDITVSNISIDGPGIICAGTGVEVSIDNCGSADDQLIVTVSNTVGPITITDCDDIDIRANSGTTNVFGSTWYDATDECEFCYTGAGTVSVHTWEYNGNNYALDSDSSGVFEDFSTTYSFSRGHCYATMQFDIDWEGTDNADIATVYIGYGNDDCYDSEVVVTRSGGYYTKKINIDSYCADDCDFYWRAIYVLCEGEDHEAEVSSTCTKKNITCGFCY